jgi:hypothetical protein
MDKSFQYIIARAIIVDGCLGFALFNSAIRSQNFMVADHFVAVATDSTFLR